MKSNVEDKPGLTIEPWLSVSNGADAITFYESAFGAVQVYRMDAPDGSVVARLKIQDAGFWISGGTEKNSELQKDGPVRMIITTQNPEILFNQSLKAGSTEIFPIGEEYGWRLGRLQDPFGHHWEIGCLIE